MNKKGPVWLKFMCCVFKGDLKELIANLHKMLPEIALVKLGVQFLYPRQISRGTVQCCGQHHYEQNYCWKPKYSSSFKRFCILRNPEKPEPEKLLSHLKRQPKNKQTRLFLWCTNKKKGQKKGQHGPYCAPGKHNPNPNPNAKNCWKLHHELRPNSSKPSAASNPPTTQLFKADEGHKLEALYFSQKTNFSWFQRNTPPNQQSRGVQSNSRIQYQYFKGRS